MIKRASTVNLALVTAPDMKTARNLARAAVDAKLAACVNIIPAVESIYRWQGKTEKAREALLVIKATRKNLRTLERFILSAHPYDTPEFLAIPVTAGSAKYLEWLHQP